MNLSEILGSLKRDKKGKKKIMEDHQTVARPHNDTPGCWATVWCVSGNFKLQTLILKQHQIFKISYFHKSY